VWVVGSAREGSRMLTVGKRVCKYNTRTLAVELRSHIAVVRLECIACEITYVTSTKHLKCPMFYSSTSEPPYSSSRWTSPRGVTSPSSLSSSLPGSIIAVVSRANAAPSFFPLSTLTRNMSGMGRPISTARNQNAGRMSPVASVIAPTIAGPKTLLPLSVIA
jgi:hypothetical protein